jgi:hypothetical protein
MNSSPSVVVNKGGFFSALAKGLFGTIMVTVICGTTLGLYGLHIANSNAALVLDNAGELIGRALAVAPEWQEAMPPAIQDALRDRRAPEYRDQVEVSGQLVADARGATRIMVEVSNRGDEMLSMLPLRVVVEDGDGVPVYRRELYAVTPLLLCDEWPGPMMPQSGPRKFTLFIHRNDVPADARVTVEMTELRVAVSQDAQTEAGAAEDVELVGAPRE